MLDRRIDRERLVDGVELVRTIAANAPLHDMIAFELSPGRHAEDRAAIEQALPAAMSRFNHPCSTNRMGADGNPTTVVDAEGRERAVAALRVEDASIFLDIPACPINHTVIMAAEKLSESIGRG